MVAGFDAEFTDIAIIGMSGRFPEADTIRELWENLIAGEEKIRAFDEKELIDSGISSSLYRSDGYVARGGVLNGIENFDADFFEFTPNDAKLTDPQQRLFLECAWEALESAGYPPTSDPRNIGVYGSMSLSTYLLHHIAKSKKYGEEVLSYPVIIGNDKDFLSTRVSYKLNLSGPSISIQTACSSSLVAIHVACQSLINGECEMALAGGVSITVPQHTGYLYKDGGTLSKDGRCMAFDDKASGTVKGNGCGIVLLKPLEQALLDRDTVYAVIKSTALNNDGRLKIGFTAPSAAGQTKAIRDAISMAGISAEDISYVEAHGTGTGLGDPIEMKALIDAFSTTKKQYCAIGSIKPNIGHLDAAAGVANLIKAALVVKEDVIPSSLHYGRPNRNISFENSPFYVNESLQRRSENDSIEYVGVSSLGMGGTNAFAVLKKGPKVLTESQQGPHLFILSGKSEKAVHQMIEQLNLHLDIHQEQSLSDMAFTLAIGRKPFDIRAYFVCQDRKELLSKTTYNQNCSILKVTNTDQCPIAFKLSTISSLDQYRELYDALPIYQTKIEQLIALIQQPTGTLIRSWFLNTKQDSAADEIVIQFISLHALVSLLIDLGIKPANYYSDDIVAEYVVASITGKYELGAAIDLLKDERSGSREVHGRHNYHEGINVIEVPFSDTGTSPLDGLLNCIGKAWATGTDIDWMLLYQGYEAGRVPMPTYPFERKRYWIDLEHKDENTKSQVQDRIPEAALSIEQIFTDIWKKHLDIEEIKSTDDFFHDLGGDSLSSVEIVSDINKILSIKLSLQDFMEYSTISSLVKYVQKGLPHQLNSDQVVFKIKEGTLPGAVFLIHPAGGTIMVYHQLAAHMKSHPTIYGIKFPTKLLNTPNLSMQRLAEFYMSEIRKVQPNGPYVLGGYSFGGNAALEISLQFQRAGEIVTDLIMFDSFVPSAYHGQFISREQFLKAFPAMVNSFFKPEVKLEYEVLTRIQSMDLSGMVSELHAMNIIPQGFAASDMMQLFEIWCLNIQMLQEHKPTERFLGRALIFDAVDTRTVLNELMVYLGQLNTSKLDWRNIIEGDVHISPIAANHYSLFNSNVYLQAMAFEIEQKYFIVTV